MIFKFDFVKLPNTFISCLDRIHMLLAIIESVIHLDFCYSLQNK